MPTRRCDKTHVANPQQPLEYPRCSLRSGRLLGGHHLPVVGAAVRDDGVGSLDTDVCGVHAKDANLQPTGPQVQVNVEVQWMSSE